jgi:hypothetical protein
MRNLVTAYSLLVHVNTRYVLHGRVSTENQFIIGLQYYVGTRGDVVVNHYATNRQVAGSIPDGVIGIFH